MAKQMKSEISDLKAGISDSQPLRVLIVEDMEDDALLEIRELKKGGYHPVYERVETAAAMSKALHEQTWDVILCDYRLPHFNAVQALSLYKKANIDIPFIIVSGAIGEETAVECMRLGAHDYIMKGNLPRLVPAMQREIAEAKSRTEHRRTDEELKKSKQLLESVFNSSQDLILVVNRDRRVLMSNWKSPLFAGHTEFPVGSHCYEAFIHRDIPCEPCHILGIFNTGKPILVEYYNQYTKLFKEVTAYPIFDDNNHVTMVAEHVRDITERKRVEGELQDTLASLRKAISTTIQVMVSTVEARDPYTAGHQVRVADLARAIATEMGLPQEKIEGIKMAGTIHDLGKLSIPAEILSKPAKLTNIEFSLIKEHCQKGYEMLKDVESPWLLAQIVLQHHERMDGSGYPQGIKGEDIMQEARILAVADVVEAIASHRPHRPSLGIDVALEEISRNRGILYNTDAVDVCLKLFREKGYHLDSKNSR
jgi:HD-GYP domain-containing protein (c-di-GMP phosphodiesterase class II)/DNA-binding NarL/FixJ family response regulator